MPLQPGMKVFTFSGMENIRQEIWDWFQNEGLSFDDIRFILKTV